MSGVSHTKEWRAEYAREWRKKNPGRRGRPYDKAAGQSYYQRNREMICAKNTARRLGCTPEAVLELKARGRCDSCGTEDPGSRKGWHIDHDHTTGALRGLLCHGCNVAAGAVGDDPTRLRAVAEYLERA